MSTIKYMSEIDDIQKSIYRLTETVDHAFKAASNLDDKVSMERLRKKTLEIDRLFKLQRFEFEDAINLARGATRCETCSTVIKKE